MEYARVGDEGGGWPGTFQDVGRGLDHLERLAREYDLDLARSVVGGHSAGGTLALWAAGRERIEPSSPLHAEAPFRFGAVFGLAAVGDLEGVWMLQACGDVVGQLMGASPQDAPDRWAAASPMQLAPPPIPATLLYGRTDTWTPPSLSYAWRARTLSDFPIEILELPESGHFEMIDPSTSSWPVVLEALRETFDAITRRR